MGHAKYFVSHDGTNQGPFDMTTIHEKLSDGELSGTDHIYLEATDKWVSLSQHLQVEKTPEETSEEMNFTSHEETHPEASETQWYVLKGKNRYGPFIFLDVVRMLQEKSVFEFDYVWRDGLDNWKRLAEVSEFEASKIRALISEHNPRAPLVFHSRRHKRFKYECPLVAHDNAQVWMGKTVELSEGGAGIQMENALILPGQNVYIHFKPGPTSKPFNVLCEVVSKKYEKGISNKSALVVYGVKFINIHKQDSDEIKTIQIAA